MGLRTQHRLFPRLSTSLILSLFSLLRGFLSSKAARTLLNYRKKMDSDCETTDVLICGCGPTGAMLSAYLGRLKISNVVLEKEADITTDPRGIALDEDGIRYLQGLGLYDQIFTDIGSCMRMEPVLQIESYRHS